MAIFGLNIFYFIYMKRDWAEHRCYVEALSHKGMGEGIFMGIFHDSSLTEL